MIGDRLLLLAAIAQAVFAAAPATRADAAGSSAELGLPYTGLLRVSPASLEQAVEFMDK